MTKHGRVAGADAAELFRAEAAGRPLPRLWRGPSDAGPAEQAASVAAFRWAERHGGTARRPTGEGETWCVPVDRKDDSIELQVSLRRRMVTRPGTCDDLDAGETANAETWHVAGIVAKVRS